MKFVRKLGKQKFVRDTVVMQVSSMVQAGTYLATSVLIARHLGDSDLGRWSAAREIFSVAFILLSAGMLQVTVSRYSAALGRGDRERAADVLASLLKLSLGYSVLVLLLGAVAAPAFAAAAYHDRGVGVIAAVLCVTAFFESVKTLTYAALQGSRQMVRYAKLDMTLAVLRVGLIAIAVFLGAGIQGVMWAYLLHGVVVTVLSLSAYGQARTSDPAVRPPSLRRVLLAVPSARVRELFGPARILAILKAMNTFIPRLGIILIPMVGLTVGGSFGEGGVYSVAFAMSWGLGLMCSGVSQALLPALGLKMGRSDVPLHALGRELRRVSMASGGLMLLMVAVSAAIMPWLVRLLYGPGYEGAAQFYLWIALGNVFVGFAVIVEPFYIYSGRMKTALKLNCVFSAIMIGMILLGAWMRGPMGVAVASGLCRGLSAFHLVYIWRYFRQNRDLGPPPGPASIVSEQPLPAGATKRSTHDG